MSLRRRLVLLVLLASLPLLGITLYTTLEIRRDEVSTAQDEIQGLARIAEGKLRVMLDASESLLFSLSQVPELARGDADACGRLYTRLQHGSNFNTSLVATDEQGRARCDNQGLRSTLFVGDRDYFKRARDSGRFAAGAPVVSRLSGRTVIPIAYPLLDAQGKFRGVIASGIDLTQFSDVFVESLANRGLILNIWNPDGGQLYPSLSGAQAVDQDSGIRRAVLTRQSRSVSVDARGPDGVERFYVITGLEDEVTARASISVGLPMQELLASSNRAFAQMLISFGIVFAVTLAVALALAEFTVRRRVVALSTAAQRLAAGDLSARTGVPHSGDELGTLARGFDSMAESLQVRALELRRAHQMAKLAHIVTGHDGTVESWSDTLPDLIGRSRDALPRSMREWLVLIHPDEQAGIRARAIEAHDRKARVDMEYRMSNGTGEWIHIRQIMERLDADGAGDGADPHWFHTIQDVSVQKQAEQRIRSQLEHLALLDQITRAVGDRLDMPSIFQVVVRTLEDSLSLDFACVCLCEEEGSVLKVVHLGAGHGALLEHLTLAENSTIAVEANGLSRVINGDLVYERDLRSLQFPFPQQLAAAGLRSIVLAPLRSESRVFGLLIAARSQADSFTSTECEFLRQLSEHVALAAQQAQLYGALQGAYDDLRQTQQAVLQQERLRSLGQMASGIAHDINNALSPVSLYTESLLDNEPNLSARARGYLETIQRAVDDVAKTVARMREFYRKRDVQLELEPVDVNRLIQQVVDLTRARWSDMAQQRGIVIELKTELAAGLPQIMGVESEIREALTNLIFNAVDAMPEGGALRLSTRLAGADSQRATVVIEVTDSGAGMDEDTRQRCLEPFFTTKGERGTGLGLAMVFGTMQRHGAELEIDSTPGAGTTVRLVFAVPVTVDAQSVSLAETAKVPSRLHLLLVDDDPILLKSLRDALETDGHVVAAANGGEAGIAAFRGARDNGRPFAAVVTDLGMPYVDGRRVAAAVKQTSPDTPVIMLTGWGQRLVAEGDIPPHVDRVLAKPPKLRELREALVQLCRSGEH